MNVLIYLLPMALGLGLAGLVAFMWALRNGQFNDVEGAALRVLTDEDLPQSSLRAAKDGGAPFMPQGVTERVAQVPRL